MSEITKEARIQILDDTYLDALIIILVRNGYKVCLHQDKKSIHIEVANYYFKEANE